MASIRRRKNSKYWTACITDYQGNRKQVTTKKTNKRDAQEFADALEKVTREKRSSARFKRVASQYHQILFGSEFLDQSVQSYLDEWITSKSGVVAPATLKSYKSAVKCLTDFLGDLSTEPLDIITTKKLSEFQDITAKRTSSQTANNQIKYLRVCFDQA